MNANNIWRQQTDIKAASGRLLHLMTGSNRPEAALRGEPHLALHSTTDMDELSLETVQGDSPYASDLLASCSSCFHSCVKNCALFAAHFLSVLMELPMDIMDTKQENTLEKSLRLAADEPAHRPDFFKTLLNSTIYVLGTAGAGEGQINLEAGSNISIAHWQKPDGSAVIPFFSSLQTLQRSMDSEESYIEIPARSLFEITLGTPLFLNPKSPYGKEFFPEEVRHLLSDEIGQKPVQRMVEKDTKVLLGQPSQYPSKMVNSLTQLLAKHRNVKRAFLALMHDVSSDQKPHLIIGIEADGDIELVMREAGNVAGDTAPDGEPVDLYRVHEGESGLSDYFLKQTAPFYERKSAGWLRSLFGFGKA